MFRPAFEHGFTYDMSMMRWPKEMLIPFNRNELWNLHEELERIDQNAAWSCAAASVTTMRPLEASTAASKARHGQHWSPPISLSDIFLQHQQLHAEILAAIQHVEEDTRGPSHDAEEGEEEEELDLAVLKTKIRAPLTFWCQRSSLTSEQSIANARP
eukprot:jgi/Tetstr1/439831/TSEL_028242.t1